MTQNITVQFSLDVEKTTINKSVSTHLINTFPDEELKNSILQISQGKTLKKAEANKLLKSLMAAMVSEDLEEDEENETFQDTQDTLSQNTETQSQNSQVSSNQNQQSQSQSSEGQNKNSSSTQVCRFYKQGNCKFGKDCRNDHPKFCKKFTKHGILKYSSQGCDGKCGKLHPSACRDSLRTKECLREKCRFYHIKGTNVNVKKSNEKPQKEEKPQAEIKPADFLEMQKLMLETIERMINQKLENFRPMASPQTQCMGQSQRPSHGKCTNC
jgi:hypothetical protein